MGRRVILSPRRGMFCPGFGEVCEGETQSAANFHSQRINLIRLITSDRKCETIKTASPHSVKAKERKQTGLTLRCEVRASWANSPACLMLQKKRGSRGTGIYLFCVLPNLSLMDYFYEMAKARWRWRLLFTVVARTQTAAAAIKQWGSPFSHSAS